MEPLESLLERTLLARGRSPATVRAYRECLRQSERFVAKPLRRATLGDLQALRDAGRGAIRLHLEGDIPSQIERLRAAIS